MPEGDTLLKAARRLQPALEGHVPRQVKLDRRRAPSLEKRIGRVEALGKHLLIEFDDGEVMRTHLGMHGSWRLLDGERAWPKKFRVSVELWLERQVAVCFDAKEVEFLHRRSLRSHPTLGRLGPDILGEIDLADIALRARTLGDSRSLLVDLLLDQRITCGIGNVYKNEVLFLEQVSPMKRLGELDDRALGDLFRRARELMRANLEQGPRVTTARASSLAERLPRTWVYGRAGRPCLECGSAIRYQRLGQRPRDTYWCPDCQP